MATIKDIAKAIVDRHKMKIGASEEFLQMMVEVINEGLLNDRIVKIKGFGTFKLQEVKERKSVNVNTGESVVIAAHDRVTFTPDSVMRDLVNKPFAQFDTVVVEKDQNAVVPQKEEPKVEEFQEKEPKAEKIEKEAQKAEESKPIEKIVEQPDAEEPIHEESVQEDSVVEETPAEESGSSRKWLYIIVGGIAVAAICFALGYLASHNGMFDKSEVPVTNQTEQVQKQDTVSVTDTIAVEAKTVETKSENFDKYNNDARVKYGAYKIIGTDTTVTVIKGQTLRGISKAYLGPDMECYVEAYNNTKEVKEGDKVLIPKLKVKKRKK